MNRCSVFNLLGGCNLPSGDEAASEMTDSEVEKLRVECLYGNLATDKVVILSAMCKTAAARQRWIRSSSPTITEVIDCYPRLEDMPLELVGF